MKDIDLLKVTPDNIHQLQQIGRQTFFETFASVNSEENMQKYLDEGFSKPRLAAELNDENCEFYFANLNALVIGYLKLNIGSSQSELKEDNALEIERIYVL